MATLHTFDTGTKQIHSCKQLSLREDFLIYAFYFYINQGVYIMQKNVVVRGGGVVAERTDFKKGEATIALKTG